MFYDLFEKCLDNASPEERRRLAKSMGIFFIIFFSAVGAWAYYETRSLDEPKQKQGWWEQRQDELRQREIEAAMEKLGPIPRIPGTPH